MSTDTTTRYAYKCPECGDHEHLDVSVQVFARLVQYDAEDFETDIDEAEYCGTEWDDGSTMICRACGHSADASEFSTPEAEDEDNEERETA